MYLLTSNAIKKIILFVHLQMDLPSSLSRLWCSRTRRAAPKGDRTRIEKAGVNTQMPRPHPIIPRMRAVYAENNSTARIVRYELKNILLILLLVTCDEKRECCLCFVTHYPFLPLVFGIVSCVRPFKVIMQYHSLSGKDKSVNFYVLHCHPREEVLVIFCVQLMEAV